MDIHTISHSKPYRAACTALVATAYFTLIFTSWGNPYHGPGRWSVYVQDILLVIGAYASIELYRGAKASIQRAFAVMAGIPLFLLIAFSIYWAVKHYYWPGIFG